MSVSIVLYVQLAMQTAAGVVRIPVCCMFGLCYLGTQCLSDMSAKSMHAAHVKYGTVTQS